MRNLKKTIACIIMVPAWFILMIADILARTAGFLLDTAAGLSSK